METGKEYHIYTHANGFENLFREKENYRFFLKRYQDFIPPIADTYTFCLMPNHLHLLIRIKDREDLEMTFGKFETDQKLEQKLSKHFSNLFSSYTQSYNKVYRRRGSLFIPNFKRKEIASEDSLTRVMLYIHSNPVHHGFVKNLYDWHWSSYNAFNNDEWDWLKKAEVIEWFGGKEELIRIHQEYLKNKTSQKLETFGKF